MRDIRGKFVEPVAMPAWGQPAPAMGRLQAEKILVESRRDILVRTSPKNGLTVSVRVPHKMGVCIHVHVSDGGYARLSLRAGYRLRDAVHGKSFPSPEALYRVIKRVGGSALFGTDPIVPSLRRHRRLAWGPHNTVASSFTDPRKHNPRSFQYLIKGVTLWGKFESFVKSPESIRKQLNSASVIRHDFQRWIFGCTGGFILRAPTQAFYAASHQDMFVSNSIVEGSTRQFAEYMARLYERFSLPSPKKICSRGVTSFSRYNEVAVLGTTADGEHVVIDGVFVERGVNDDVTSSLRTYAQARGLPVVELEQEPVDGIA